MIPPSGFPTLSSVYVPVCYLTFFYTSLPFCSNKKYSYAIATITSRASQVSSSFSSECMHWSVVHLIVTTQQHGHIQYSHLSFTVAYRTLRSPRLFRHSKATNAPFPNIDINPTRLFAAEIATFTNGTNALPAVSSILPNSDLPNSPRTKLPNHQHPPCPL